VEVWPVHTVQFSNHTGYGAWRGRVFDGGMVREVVQGIEERGVLGSCNGALSGYMGDIDIGEAILGAVERVKTANPAALYCCDPVIGDVGRGIYVRPGVPEFMRGRALPAADIVTPNQFELDFLAGAGSETLRNALAAIDCVHAIGPRIVLITSLHTDDTPGNALDLIASDGEGRWRVRTPRLKLSVNGAGDMIAALFLARFLREGSVVAALSLSVASVFGVLRRTEEAGSRELLLIAAQEECVNPSLRLAAERL
jgi:pyridoxine kinase